MSAEEEPVADGAEEAAPAASPAKSSGDFVKTYVIVMGLLALVLMYVCWQQTSKRAAFEEANARAEAIFGGATLPASQIEKPTTIRGLAVGIQKFLQTYDQAKVKPGEKEGIPIKLIRDRAEAMGLAIRQITPENSTPNRQRGYDEISTTITFEPTDLERLANFLYNLEDTGGNTKLRILDVRWDLKSDKDNPYQPGSAPGYLINAPTVKIGLRKPITKETGK
jgi:hypothetical protein